MKKLFMFGYLLGLFLALPVYAGASNSNVRIQDIISVAQDQLPSLLESIPEGDEELFGFHNREEFDSADLDTPYRMSVIDENGSVVFLSTWRVPVTINNEFRALIDVRKEGNRFEISGLGAAGLAGELDELEKNVFGAHKWRLQESKTLLRSYRKKADFVVFDADVSLNRQNLKSSHSATRAYPLKSGRMALNELKKEKRGDVNQSIETTVEEVIELLEKQ